MSKCGKRLKGARELVKCDSYYNLSDAITLLFKYKDQFAAKFDETVEFTLRLNVDTRKVVVRDKVSMPAGLGKDVKIAAFVPDELVDVAKRIGADVVGGIELIDTIKKNGAPNVDVCIAVPSMMPKIAADLGKILGPKGLMPNPKLGTVGTNLEEMIRAAKAGQCEFRADKGGVVHAGIGKCSFSSEMLISNIKALCKAVVTAKPAGTKGKYQLGCWLSTSHGISVPLNVDELFSDCN